jgi:hypothetical protein
MTTAHSPADADVPADNAPGARRSEWLIRVAAVLLLGGSCFAAGARLVDSGIYEADVFDADPRRVVHDIGRVGGTHYRTKVHPLFVLLVNPPGALLKAVVGRPRIAALLLNAAANAFAVLLLYGLLIRLGLRRARSALWSVLFATTSSQVFFGIVPETYAFSGASLLLLFLVFARAESGWLSRVAAAVLSFGVTVTNLVAALGLALFSGRRGAGSRWPAQAVLLGAAVVLSTAGLSCLQKALYPEAEVFFVRSSVTEESSYLFHPRGLGDVAERGASVAVNLLFANLAAPKIDVRRQPGEPPTARFGWPRPAGWVHALVWVTLCALAADGLTRGAAARDPVVGPLLAWIGFNAALHLAYGQTLFLYSCQWTFAVIAVVAVGVERSGSRRLRLATAGAVLLLVGLQLATNASFVADLYTLYR